MNLNKSITLDGWLSKKITKRYFLFFNGKILAVKRLYLFAKELIDIIGLKADAVHR